jgi:hypothetical protein
VNNLLPKCLVCGETPERGLAAGIFLCRRFLCDSCGAHIAALCPGEKDYAEVARRLRRLWERPDGEKAQRSRRP